jgi:hypothetical protein
MGPRLIGPQAHRFDDAAALLVDRFIMLAHERQQRVKLRRGGRALQSNVPYLRAQKLVQVRMISQPARAHPLTPRRSRLIRAEAS